MKIAYFGVPHIGGTYTVYRSLKVGLAQHGVEVKWLGIGPPAKAALEDRRWSEDRDAGIVISGGTSDDRIQGEALVRYLESSDLDGVFVNVLANRTQANAMRYLDHRVRRVMIVHSITPGTYAYARELRDHVHATVGVSPRIQSDLITCFGFSDTSTFWVPSGLALEAFAQERIARDSNAPIRVLYLGRIVDADKGVFWLPKIMARLPAEMAHLTIVGEGRDLPALRRRCDSLGKQVTFLGRMSPSEVPSVMASNDVLIFPSRFEGLGLTLVEAMSSGCVPVATRIRGVTDYVVRSGDNGFLFDVGSVSAAAQAIRQLALDRCRLSRMSIAAQQSVKRRFSISEMACSYMGIIEGVRDTPIVLSKSKSLSQWQYPAGLRPGIRTYLPLRVKNILREWKERVK